MKLNKFFFLKSIAVSLIIASFFIGYFLRENASGGGLEFYDLSWPIINSFKEDFIFTISNYGSFGDASLPLAHIINAYLNPFSNNDTNLQLSITIISFVVFLVFALGIRQNFSYVKYVDIYLTSSVILILPFFRASAFWGKPENFSWLFFIISLYFFSKLNKIYLKNPIKKKYSILYFFVFLAHVHFMLDNLLFFCLFLIFYTYYYTKLIKK